jgi:di-N-acetylchitobiase
MFSLDPSGWRQYRWEQTTVLALFYAESQWEHELLCVARQNNVRVVTAASFPVSELLNRSAVELWLEETVDKVRRNNLDGVNLDTEDPIPRESPLRSAYTGLVAELSQRLKTLNPFHQVSVDIPWSPACIDGRCYDFEGLAQAADFLLVMAYDIRSQVFEPRCTAGANSPISKVRAGIEGFLALRISRSKLVLGLPWYGYGYPCLNQHEDPYQPCLIRSVPFRGVNCSDAAGREYDLPIILHWLEHSITGNLYDTDAESPFFSFRDEEGLLHQAWYDDARAISKKTAIAVEYGLAGIGIWNVDAVYGKYSTPHIVDQMWNALKEPFLFEEQ